MLALSARHATGAPLPAMSLASGSFSFFHQPDQHGDVARPELVRHGEPRSNCAMPSGLRLESSQSLTRSWTCQPNTRSLVNVGTAN